MNLAEGPLSALRSSGPSQGESVRMISCMDPLLSLLRDSEIRESALSRLTSPQSEHEDADGRDSTGRGGNKDLQSSASRYQEAYGQVHGKSRTGHGGAQVRSLRSFLFRPICPRGPKGLEHCEQSPSLTPEVPKVQFRPPRCGSTSA